METAVSIDGMVTLRTGFLGRRHAALTARQAPLGYPALPDSGGFEFGSGSGKTERGPLIVPGKRHYCKRCGTPLWVSDEQWPELVHPFASAIDTELPQAPSSVHLLLRDKPSWVEPQIGPNDDCFEGYPKLSIEDWHKKHGLWVK